MTLQLNHNYILHIALPNCEKCFMYEGAKLWNSINNGIKTTENISEFITLLTKWNGTPCIIM